VRTSSYTYGPKSKVPVRLRRISQAIEMMRRPVDYLEIGVRRGETFFGVPARTLVGVDPFPDFDTSALPDRCEFFETDSDAFFREHGDSRAFDFVFIDGLHEWRQTYRDVLNSLRVLRPGGLLLIDDVLPIDWPSAQSDPGILETARAQGVVSHGCWYGDVYKVLKIIDEKHPELGFLTFGERNPRNHGTSFVWRRQNQAPRSLPAAQDGYLDYIDALDFNDVFSGSGTPRWFRRRAETSWAFKALASGAA
jgi:SAM-dependent methyltransferase